VRALAVPTDVADAQAVEAAAARVERELGEIDVWVNVAMATIFAPLSSNSPRDFERATQVTYLGQVHGTMAALARMRTRNRGAIVNVGSALASRAIPLQSAYCGAKFAERGFTDAESGWDFSSRWFGDNQNLWTVRTTSIIPVDLNSLLFHLETTIVRACTVARDFGCVGATTRRPR
jgi:NAD(P)-dependent dehydrogenase (short-subunit alcohol dehydrogenase family)